MGAPAEPPAGRGEEAARAETPFSARRGFYQRVARSETESLALEEAAAVEGLGEEIAVLRLRLRDALNAEQTDMRAVLAGLEVLRKAVATEYRLSPRARKDLADNMAAVLNSLGDAILPADR